MSSLCVCFALLTIAGFIVKLHWSFASCRGNTIGKQMNFTTGSASDLHFGAIGMVVQNKFYPEILSLGFPTVNGTFFSFSTKYFPTDVMLYFLSNFSYTHNIFYHIWLTDWSDWCQTVKIFPYPALDLCKCSRLLLETQLKLSMFS